jgi:endonuclease YncB( thermonuclease family)
MAVSTAGTVILPFLFQQQRLTYIYQYDTAYDIPSKAFDRNAVLYGRVEKVVDGDTIRIRYGVQG